MEDDHPDLPDDVPVGLGLNQHTHIVSMSDYFLN